MLGTSRELDGAAWGAQIAQWRAVRGYTQRQAAERAGVSQGTWCAAERGLRPVRWVTLARVALALGVSMDELRRGPVGGRGGLGQ